MSSKVCSFCGSKPSQKNHQLIQGSEGVHICFDCVRTADQTFQQDVLLDGGKGEARLRKPKQIKAYLDDHIISQDHAKKALAVAVYNHYKRLEDLNAAQEPSQKPSQKRVSLEGDQASASPAELSSEGEEPSAELKAEESSARALREQVRQGALTSGVKLTKGNILMVGPTGVGKTALAERIAELLDVPFVVKDATTLTAAGYVGEDVETIIKSLWEAAGRDVERAARGIVVIDEVDKIARRGASSQSGRDVGGESVQQALLKLIESTHVNIQPEGGRMPRSAPIQVDTTNILFIVCGAFVGLDKLIERRKSPGSIGFGAQKGGAKGEASAKARRSQKDLTYNELICDLQTEDLLKFGMIPEFMGRLPVVVYLEDLDEEALREVLWKPKDSLIKQYQHLFSLNDVELEFTPEAMLEVVRKAMTRKSGARGLRSVVEHMMLNVMYDLPDRADLAKVVIEAEFVRGEVDEPTYVKREESA